MDFKQNFHEVLLIIWLLCTEQGLSFMQDDDYFDEPSFNRCPWIRNKLKNGRVRYRYKGRVAKFLCDSGFELAGKRSSTCVRGQWSNPIPVCVARGCPRVNSISNGRITEMYRGALLMYDCNPGYMLDGNPTIHCDGRRWSSLPPLCVIATEKPETYCDFENPDLCGWSHDPNHDFDWQRNQFSTPSGHVGTGPAFDHTFGENKGGFYLYIEASSPRKINDTARLFSPVYSEDLSGGCFIFWYHMYGATTGGLRVYLKPESHVFDELKPNWEKYGDQGNQWLKGHMIVPVLHENFQIVIEGVRGESYVGDSAIDDVRLTSNLCDSDDNSTDIAETVDQYSCRGRCQESGSESSCGCNINCVDEPNFCCRDYYTICTAGNSTTVQNTDEPPPEVFTTLSAATLISTMNTKHKNTENVSAISTQLETKVTEITENTYFNSSSPLTTKSILPNTENVTANSSQNITDASTENQPSRETTTSIKSTTMSEAFSSTSIKTQAPTTLTTGKTTQLPVVILNNTTSEKTTFETTTSSTAKITSTTPPTTVSVTKQTTTSQTTPVNKDSDTTATSFSTRTTFLETTVQAITKPTFTEATITTINSKSSLPNENFTSSSSITTSTTEQTSLSTSTLSSTARSYNLRPRNRTSTPAYTTLLLTKTTTFTPRTLRTTDSSLSTSSRYLTSWYKYSVAPVSSQRVTSTSSTITSTLTSSQLTAKNTLISKVSTEVTSQTPKYSSRFTKPTKSSLPKSSDFYESKSETTSSNSSVPVVVSIIVVIVICIIAGLVYYMRKQRSKRQSKLSDDSEMRFLPDSDYMDYSDASALDKILVK